MYFISEKDGQNVQIELASAVVIFIPSIVFISSPLSLSLRFSVENQYCSVQGCLLFICLIFCSHDQIHTYLLWETWETCVCVSTDNETAIIGNRIHWLESSLYGTMYTFVVHSAGLMPRIWLAKISAKLQSILSIQNNVC